MRLVCFILMLLFYSQLSLGQTTYKISAVKITPQSLIKGPYGQTKGLDIQFQFSPRVLDSLEHHFEVEIKYKEQSIAQQKRTFIYSYTDSIAQLVDSLGIDSLPNLDTLLHLYIPYRNIAVEEGKHSVQISLKAQGKALPFYHRSFLLQQVKIYDIFLDLKSATVLPDSNANPLGLGYHAPDPQWLVQLGVDQELSGLANRNAFSPKAKTIKATITNYDRIAIGVFNADPTAGDYLGRFIIEHGSENFEQDYQHINIGARVPKASFHLKKIERKPAAANFNVSPNYRYKGIEGVKIDLSFGLPLQFKRRNIGIKIMNEQQLPFDNLLLIQKERVQKDNRIEGQYSYFVPYYNLQRSKAIKIWLTANNKIVKQYTSDPLNIPKTIYQASLKQTTGHLYKGISGILYQLDMHFATLPQAAQLKLTFPHLSPTILDKLFYWEANNPQKVFSGKDQKLSLEEQQTIFVFLPYFVAPAQINLTPTITIENVDIPPIQLVRFKSKAYQCPNSLNDIQIHQTSHQEQTIMGLSGQLFTFRLSIPDYYHSKGHFQLQILENGQALEKGFFINNDANQSSQFPIHNQQLIEVFIPYRFMKMDAKYNIILQAKSKNFVLSEERKETFHHQGNTVQEVGIYLQQLKVKDWKQVHYKIGIRNDKNPNSTYEHLGYTFIVDKTIPNTYKPDFPAASTFLAALDDEIVIWIKGSKQTDDQALRFTTSIRALQNNQNSLEINHLPLLKKAVFKLIDKG